MSRNQYRTYCVEISTRGGGWCKVDNLSIYDVDKWIDLLANARCEWVLTCKLEEEEDSVQGQTD